MINKTEMLLDKIIRAYLESPNSEKYELDLVDQFAYLYVNHQYNLNINCYNFDDYVIKSDTLNYVHGFLETLNHEYVEIFDEAVRTGKISFLQNKRKRSLDEKSEYEVIASHHLKDSFDLIHNFFNYLIQKNKELSKESDYFVDTISILGEFLFQDYLESLEEKNREVYYSKMNRFIYTNVFTIQMIVELKLIEFYNEKKLLNVEEDNYNSIKKILSDNCRIIIDEILNNKGISISFNKRYLYGLLFACLMHQKIIEQPKLIQFFCYLISHPREIPVLTFMENIGIQTEKKNGKIVIGKNGMEELKNCYLRELEETMIRLNVDYRKK